MRIFNFGLNLESKKYSYETEDFKKLVDKISPKKRSPYIVKVMNSQPEAADLVVIDKNKVVDFVLNDLEKIEERLAKGEKAQEKEVLEEAQNHLEAEKLLSDCSLGEEKLAFLKNLQLTSLKPAVIREGFKGSAEEINKLIEEAIAAAGRILFFTASNKEAKVWDLKRGKTVLEAAGRIHSDLMRGFIRAEIVNSRHLDDFYNMAEAKSKGLVKSVDKDYIVEDKDIIQIKFSV